MTALGVTFEPLPHGAHNIIVRCGRELVSHYDDFEFSFVLVIEGSRAMIKGAAKREGIDEKIQRKHQEAILRRIAEEFPYLETVVWERVKGVNVRNVVIKLDRYRW